LSALLDERFTSLVDTPATLTGNVLLRVNSAGTGLEFVVPENVPGITRAFTDLVDVPQSYIDQGEKIVRVKGDESGLEFVDLSVIVDTGGTPTLLASLLDLSDTPDSYAGADGFFLRVSGSQIVFDQLTFLDLADAPPSYAAPGAFLRVNSGANALTFFTKSLTFTGLTDTPGSYGVSDGGKVVRVKADRTGLEFTTGRFLDLTDTPASFSGQANRVLRVNAGATAVEFRAETFTNFTSLLDTPNAYGVGDGGKFVVVEDVATPTQLVFQSAAEIAASAQSFLTLTDTPDTYDGQIGKFVRVTPLPDGTNVLRFADVTVLSSDAAQAVLELYREEYQGGTSPVATGSNAVAIGEANTASATGSTIVGGRANTVSAVGGTVVGGFTNTLSTPGAIVGGTLNTIAGTTTFAFVGGGQQNAITNADRAVIGTGLRNQITGANSSRSVIGGGLDNSINLTANHGTYEGSVICGGQGNVVSGDGATVLAGYFTNITAPRSVAVISQSGRKYDAREAVSGDYSVVLGPQTATDRGWFGARPFANEPGSWRVEAGAVRGSFAGEIQSTTLLFAGATSTGDWTRLLLDSGVNYGNRRDAVGGYLSRITLPSDDGVYWIEAEVIGRDTSAPHSATFTLRGVVMVDAGAATLPNGFEPLAICRCGPGSAGWDARISVDGLAVDIDVKGRQSQSINWVCKVKTLELMVKQDVANSFTLTPINGFVDGGYTVNENSLGASIVTISRPGGIAGLTFTPANTAFEVTPAGVFKLINTRFLNFETTPFLNTTVYVTGLGETDYFNIPIRVLNVNEAPSNIILTDVNTGSTTERAVLSGVAGARVAYISVVDIDSTTHTLTVQTSPSPFEIVKESVGGVLRDILKLKSGSSITVSTVVQIRATDPGGLFRNQNFTVGIRT
jgi:hypothetical protein